MFSWEKKGTPWRPLPVAVWSSVAETHTKALCAGLGGGGGGGHKGGKPSCAGKPTETTETQS